MYVIVSCYSANQHVHHVPLIMSLWRCILALIFYTVGFQNSMSVNDAVYVCVPYIQSGLCTICVLNRDMHNVHVHVYTMYMYVYV